MSDFVYARPGTSGGIKSRRSVKQKGATEGQVQIIVKKLTNGIADSAAGIASFNYQDRMVWILGQTVRQDKTSIPTADNDEIVLELGRLFLQETSTVEVATMIDSQPRMTRVGECPASQVGAIEGEKESYFHELDAKRVMRPPGPSRETVYIVQTSPNLDEYGGR